MSEHGRLTDHELAAMDARHASMPHMTDGVSTPLCRCDHRWPCPTARLIADLRAARSDADRLRGVEKLLDDERARASGW